MTSARSGDFFTGGVIGKGNGKKQSFINKKKENRNLLDEENEDGHENKLFFFLRIAK